MTVAADKDRWTSKTVTALFNSKETSDAWSAMQNNPVFVQLARDPNNATNKEVLKEYMKVCPRAPYEQAQFIKLRSPFR